MTSHPNHSQTHAHEQQQDNGLAIAAFVLGIISLTGFGALTGIPAIITGFLSLKNPVNKGLGIAGLVMGAVATVFTVLVVLFFILLIILAATSGAPSHQEMPADDMPYSAHTRSI